MKKLTIKGIKNNYQVIIKRNLINELSNYVNTNNKVAILTDDNIPFTYVETINSLFNNVTLIVLQAGEKAKSFNNFKSVLEILLENNFNKDDFIIALGGGVILDLAGYVASSYKRGINLVLMPTTTLSMIDACVGSKNGINHNNVKNCFGSYYDPYVVLIDPTLLISLNKRDYNNGIVEAIKCGLIKDEALFNLIESKNYKIDEIIYKSLKVKKYFIEKDPYDNNIRHALNFGHSYGHCYESLSKYKLKHGEAVGLGMIKVLNSPIKERVINILKTLNIKTDIVYKDEEVITLLKQDKKINDNKINLVKVNTIGQYKIIKEEL